MSLFEALAAQTSADVDHPTDDCMSTCAIGSGHLLTASCSVSFADLKRALIVARIRRPPSGPPSSSSSRSHVSAGSALVVTRASSGLSVGRPARGVEGSMNGPSIASVYPPQSFLAGGERSVWARESSEHREHASSREHIRGEESMLETELGVHAHEVSTR